MPYFQTDPKTGWALVQACIAEGYDPETDGFVEFLVVNFIAKRLGK